MDKYDILNRLKKMYEDDVNIIQYLNGLDNKENNSVEDIMISYDFQAGSYVKTILKTMNSLRHIHIN